MNFSIQHLYRHSVILLCGLCLLVLTGTLSIVTYREAYRMAKVNLATQASMVALSLAPLPSLERAASHTALAPLDANRQLLLGCIHDPSTHLVADHRGPALKPTSSLTCDDIKQRQTMRPYLTANVSVIRDRLPQPIGTVTLVAKAPNPWAKFWLWFGVVAALTVALALGCWLLGLRLQAALIKPIRRIASTAQRVSLYRDYTLRVVPGALDLVPNEIQSLNESFNAMLKEIEDRDNRLSRKSAELDRARQMAESANQAKSQFLANVSHELRTPLNAIIGFSTMLSEQQFGPIGNPKYAEYAHDIHDSGKHLLDVINDILDLTKAETGQLSVTFRSLAVHKIVEKALRIIAGQAHQRKIDIYTDIPDKMPKIIADPVRLVQILLNLLSNAIKFSSEGSKVVVAVRSEVARQSVHYFTITVTDQGIGMSEADIRKAFSSFNQADAGLNRKYDGAGLGLPLTKRLVDLHHGKIKIESVEGQGTTVTVRLTSDPALLD